LFDPGNHNELERAVRLRRLINLRQTLLAPISRRRHPEVSGTGRRHVPRRFEIPSNAFGKPARLRARGVAFQLYLVGDGPLAERVRSWIREAGGEDVMHVVGPVEHARLADWYRAADVTVLASRSEGVPNVLKESLACGTPFVATSVGGIPELVREPSQLVPPGDPEALAGAIERRLSSVASTWPPRQSSWADAASSVAALARSLRENTAPPARNGR